MAPSWVAAGALSHNTVGVTPAAPAGLDSNYIEFLLCESADEPISLVTPNGFAQVPGSPISVPDATATVKTRGALFWRRYSGQGNPVTNDPGNHILAQRYAVSGSVQSGEPWDVIAVSSEAVEDTTGIASGTVSSGENRLVLIFGGGAKPDSLGTAEISSIANANLSNLAERADNAGNSGNGGHIWAASGELAAAGATGDTTYTKATAAYKWHFVVVLRPEETILTRSPKIQVVKQQSIVRASYW